MTKSPLKMTCAEAWSPFFHLERKIVSQTGKSFNPGLNNSPMKWLFLVRNDYFKNVNMKLSDAMHQFLQPF